MQSSLLIDKIMNRILALTKALCYCLVHRSDVELTYSGKANETIGLTMISCDKTGKIFWQKKERVK